MCLSCIFFAGFTLLSARTNGYVCANNNGIDATSFLQHANCRLHFVEHIDEYNIATLLPGRTNFSSVGFYFADRNTQ